MKDKILAALRLKRVKVGIAGLAVAGLGVFGYQADPETTQLVVDAILSVVPFVL